MKKTLLNVIEDNIKKIIKNNFSLKIDKVVVDKTKDINMGDLYTNAAMKLGSFVKKPVNDIAKTLIDELFKLNIFENIIFKNGFINMFLSNKTRFLILKNAIKFKKDYGQFNQKKISYNIEFVSANPTGFLHIGHARNAALGMTLSNVWKKFGITVDNEYYVNDAGSQIDKLGMSVFTRYLQKNKIKVKMNKDWYQGEEPKIIAKEINDIYKKKFIKYRCENEKINNKKVFDFFKDYSKNAMLSYIKSDLSKFKIKFKKYFFESTIYQKDLINKTLKKLKNYTYLNDGATWLKTANFYDVKDRVIIKSNKSPTYFMPDIAYHDIKLSRGYNKIFNIFGADHGTYVSSIKSAIKCLGHNSEKLDVIIMQMVKLSKNGEEFKMSKRSGNSLTLRDLIKAIGVDAARWSLVTQAADTHLEIDVEKFSSENQESDIYYIFYAFARINKLINKHKKYNLFVDNVNLLNLDIEKELINAIFYYPQTIANVAKYYEIQKIPTFILSFASLINKYYSQVRIVLEENKELSTQRIFLLNACKQVLISGLDLMDIKPKNKLYVKK